MPEFKRFNDGKHYARVTNCKCIYYPHWHAEAEHLNIYVCKEDYGLYFIDCNNIMQPLHHAYKVVYN